MQLFRLTAMLLVAAAVSACHDSTAPILRTYTLTEIDGHPLPVSYMGIDAGTTVVSGTLYLTEAGRALRIDRYRDFSANDGQTFDRTETLRDDYRIANDSITVGSFGTCTSFCRFTDVGAFSESGLTLTHDVSPRTAPVYTYRLAIGL